jgi:hypothetical protein
MTAKINKNALYHAVNAMLDIYRAGEADGATMRAFRQYIYALGNTGLGAGKNQRPITKTVDIDWMLDNVHSADDLVDYITSIAPKDIEWIEDDFTPPPVYRGKVHTQKIASMMTILHCSEHINNYVPAARAWRDIFNVSTKDMRVSAAHYSVHGGKKVRAGSTLEHRYPLNWIKEIKMPYIKNVQHLSRVVNKYDDKLLILNEEDDVITENGHKDWMPECGGDRHELAGIEAHA